MWEISRERERERERERVRERTGGEYEVERYMTGSNQSPQDREEMCAPACLALKERDEGRRGGDDEQRV